MPWHMPWRRPLSGRLSVLLAVAFVAVFAATALNAPVRADSLGRVVFVPREITIESKSGAHRFVVEVAQTPEQRSQGLMHRRELDPERGMLFDFGEEAPVAMWMKNTIIPLDMMFIADDGRIVHIAERTVPMSLAAISPDRPVRFVLEVSGGTAARLGIAPGDRLVQDRLQTN